MKPRIYRRHPLSRHLGSGLGAKFQILSSVSPPQEEKLVTIFSQGHVWGPQKPMFY